MNGLCKAGTRCIVTKFNAETFNEQVNAIKYETREAPQVLKCSPLTCSNGQCKTATCPTGYSGNILTSPAEQGECIDDKCDALKDYREICGKDGGCDKTKGLVVEENGVCKESYCPTGYIMDTTIKKCKKLVCPNGTIEQANGSCLTK